LKTGGKQPILYLRQEQKSPEYYEIAEQLVRGLLKDPKASDELDGMINQWTVLLSSDLEVLRRRGLPVDRIMNTDRPITSFPSFPLGQPQPCYPVNRVKNFGPGHHQGIKEISSLLHKCQTFQNSQIAWSEHVEGEEEEDMCSQSCRMVPGQVLDKQQQDFSGIALFFDKQISDSLRSKCIKSAPELGEILALLTDVFNVPKATFNMFADTDGDRIAFNKGGTMFYNVRYHAQCFSQSTRNKGLHFWYITAAHELAHNKSSGHSKSHEAAMENIAIHFMPALLKHVQPDQPTSFSSTAS